MGLWYDCSSPFQKRRVSDLYSCYRWKAASGFQVHQSWEEPCVIARFDGVQQLVAGHHSSAVIDGKGQLHMWGALVSKVSVQSSAHIDARHGKSHSCQDLTYKGLLFCMTLLPLSRFICHMHYK